MSDLVETLRRCEKWLDRYRAHASTVSEADTKAGLIEPIIEELGWDIRDPEEVRREYRRLGTDNPVDYALLLLRTPRLFVEAKGIGGHLDDPRWSNQTVAYATAAGVEWVALTNGAQWRIYNAHAPVPIEKKLFRAVDLDKDPDEVVRVFRLLGKDNMGENLVDELWKSYFVDRQVRHALVELFSGGEPAKELVGAVRHLVPSLTPRDIRSSLTRARATFEFPSVTEPPAASVGSAEVITDATTTPAPPVEKVGKARRVMIRTRAFDVANRSDHVGPDCCRGDARDQLYGSAQYSPAAWRWAGCLRREDLRVVVGCRAGGEGRSAGRRPFGVSEID
jgi:hypothetical protein